MVGKAKKSKSHKKIRILWLFKTSLLCLPKSYLKSCFEQPKHFFSLLAFCKANKLISQFEKHPQTPTKNGGMTMRKGKSQNKDSWGLRKLRAGY